MSNILNSEYDVYMWVVENVVRGVEDNFSSEGVDRQVLLDLQQIWIDKLKMTNAVEPSKKPSLQNARNNNNNNNNNINNNNYNSINESVISNNLIYNNNNNTRHNTTTMPSLNQSINPFQTISINQPITQPLNTTKLKNIVLTHTITSNPISTPLTTPLSTPLSTPFTTPFTIPFSTLLSSHNDVTKNNSLTFQLLNKTVNAEHKNHHLINLQKQILVPTTQLATNQLHNNNNNNTNNNSNNNIKLLKPNIINLNPTSTSNLLGIIRPDIKSKLLQQLQQEQQAQHSNQHTKQIVIQQPQQQQNKQPQQQPNKQPQQTIRLLNTNFHIQQNTLQQQQPQQQQQHVIIQNQRQQILPQKPQTTQQQQQQQHILLQQHPQLQQQLQQLQQQQQRNILLLQPRQQHTQPLPTTNNATKTTTITTKLPQLDGVGDDEESDDDDDDLTKLAIESLDEVTASNGIYDDDEDEERDKPEENLVSDDDISVTDPSELFEVDNLIVCQYTKVNRKKIKSKWEDVRSQSKWSMTFRYGVMNINGKDILFNCLQGDACWP